MIAKTKGWKSSEFWVSLFAIALPLLDQVLHVVPGDSKFSLIGGALVAAGYSISRAMSKSAESSAQATVAVATLAPIAAPLAATPFYPPLATLETAGIGMANSALDDVLNNALGSEKAVFSE